MANPTKTSQDQFNKVEQDRRANEAAARRQDKVGNPPRNPNEAREAKEENDRKAAEDHRLAGNKQNDEQELLQSVAAGRASEEATRQQEAAAKAIEPRGDNAPVRNPNDPSVLPVRNPNDPSIDGDNGPVPPLGTPFSSQRSMDGEAQARTAEARRGKDANLQAAAARTRAEQPLPVPIFPDVPRSNRPPSLKKLWDQGEHGKVVARMVAEKLPYSPALEIDFPGIGELYGQAMRDRM